MLGKTDQMVVAYDGAGRDGAAQGAIAPPWVSVPLSC